MFKSTENEKSVGLENLAHFFLQHKWITFSLTVVLLMASLYGLKDLQVSTNYRSFFGPGNGDLQAFEEFENTYTRNDNFLFAIKAKEGGIVSKRAIEAAEELTEQAWQIPFAIRVDSITNFQNTRAESDDLIVENLFKNSSSLSPDQINDRIDIASQEPLLSGKLISTDLKTVGINVTLQYSGESLEEVSLAMNSAREIKKNIEQTYPDLIVALTGVSALNNAFAESTIADALTLFPAMFIVLCFVIWFSIRSIAGTFAALVVVSFSTMAAMGFAGLVGIAISPFSGSAPVVILTLALADCMHIFVTLKSLRSGGMDKRTSIIKAYAENFTAVSVTSLTTIIGFLALNFSDAPPFNDLGNIVAVGIFFAWALSLSLYPVLMDLLPMAKSKQNLVDRLIEKKLDFISKNVVRNYRAIIGSSAIVLTILTIFIFKIELNDPWVDYFDEKVEFRKDTEFVMENLTGLYLVEISIPTSIDKDVNDPEYLENLEKFTSWLRVRNDVSHVQSYADIIKRINKNMNSDDPEFYRLPENQQQASQYLLLYEMSLPYGLDMNDRINIDRSASRVTVTLPEISTAGVRAFVADSQFWLDQNIRAETRSVITGAPVLFARISERNIQDMFGGNLVAVGLIAAVICIALWNFRIGLISLIPNIVPIIATFGLWAILVGQVGMAAATVSATSLGIIVDNTVHLLTKYRFAILDKGLSSIEAVRYALRTVGHAVIVNTVILVAGFGVLALSSFRVTGQMGSLTALVIAVAFIVDLFLLPSILIFLNKEKITQKENDYEQVTV